ncbi:ATPase, P-type (transporting), HAD superfamily, subfamily IC/heavy metal translocating P-type ATPase [Lachnospiraceae bacterium KH1T2]|nr:ATPase, P-type (transporting), HAD superfamily, subfamily IC/heavy metal translocating P-type ATPase [Lachnospiraceae bacterium KH1T2]
MLQYVLIQNPEIISVSVHERTSSVLIRYKHDRQAVIDSLLAFDFSDEKNEELVPEKTGRMLNSEYEDKFFWMLCRRIIEKTVLPAPLRILYTGAKVARCVLKGIKSLKGGRLKVDALDATAVLVSVLRDDIDTASSIMFLLNMGSLIEDWTHKKSVDDLARSMSLNVAHVWKKTGSGEEVRVRIADVNEGDIILVSTGNMIPLDGIVVSGEAMVNQASMTGEAIPVRKNEGVTVFAGTVVEEGQLEIRVTAESGGTRYEKIVRMIEESEKLKSNLETRASSLADNLVPYSFAGTILTYLFTRNIERAISVLMVDFSCALKLAMPISVLSAMREASGYKITVKGGKYLEAVAGANTIVFDKTGTLTKANPVVVDVVTFGEKDKYEMLRLAACLEEHFPHSIANAVVNKANELGLTHEEMHSEVKYIVAHGIASSVDRNDVVIGSYHFVFEDEKAEIPYGEEEKFNELETQYSHLYMAIGGQLAAVIYISDPIREEASAVINTLRMVGIDKVVMMTGDSERTAAAIAAQVGVDEYYAEVLPEDKAAFIEKEHAAGRKVIMVGDGINDSPALSASDAGIAISEGAQIAREVADITVSADTLFELVTLKNISDFLMKRIETNYRFVIGFNFGLIALGVMGILPPATSAVLHNLSTLGVSLHSMTDLISRD